jgi:hypothetical protein
MSETHMGEVRGRVIVLDEGSPHLPEGTRVRVEPADAKDLAELSEILLEFAGQVRDLPPDMAEQHDHYLHGRPKRSSSDSPTRSTSSRSATPATLPMRARVVWRARPGPG